MSPHKYLPTYESTNQSSLFNLCFLFTYLHVTYVCLYAPTYIFTYFFGVCPDFKVERRGTVPENSNH